PKRLSSFNVGNKDWSGANRRTPQQPFRLSDWSEVRLVSGARSPLSCSHPERSSHWSEVSPADRLNSLSCSHPERSSVWSELKLSPYGRLNSLSCSHPETLSVWSEVRPASSQ